MTMTRAVALGIKRKCLNCGAPFFDLQHDPIICPKCNEVFTPPPPPSSPVRYRRMTPGPIEPGLQPTTARSAVAEVEASDKDDPAGVAEDDLVIEDDEEESESNVAPAEEA